MKIRDVFVLSVFCITLLWINPASSQNVNQLVPRIVKPFITQNQLPGIAIAIYYQEQDYYFNYGSADIQKKIPVTKDTIFELASITKIFVTTLLAMEVEEGRVKLSDSVAPYLPLSTNIRELPISKVTLMQLATHTSGFPRQMEQFGVDKGNVNDWFISIRKWQPGTPIGTNYKYSNIGFGFLGWILEQITGQNLPELISSNITNPLAMNHTFFKVPINFSDKEAQGYRPNQRKAPKYVAANFLGGGALRSSSADLLTFVKANLGIKVNQVSDKLLKAMQQAQQPYFRVKPGFVMGLGWQRMRHGKDLVIIKNGGNQGFSTFIGFSPENNLGVVILINQSKAKATLLGNRLLKILINDF